MVYTDAEPFCEGRRRDCRELPANWCEFADCTRPISRLCERKQPDDATDILCYSRMRRIYLHADFGGHGKRSSFDLLYSSDCGMLW